MSRREFTKAVYAQIVKRAMLESGEIACEGCGLILGKKRYHVDHTIPDALQVDKRGKGYPTFRVGTHQNAPALKSRSKVDRLTP